MASRRRPRPEIGRFTDFSPCVMMATICRYQPMKQSTHAQGQHRPSTSLVKFFAMLLLVSQGSAGSPDVWFIEGHGGATQAADSECPVHSENAQHADRCPCSGGTCCDGSIDRPTQPICAGWNHPAAQSPFSGFTAKPGTALSNKIASDTRSRAPPRL